MKTFDEVQQIKKKIRYILLIHGSLTHSEIWTKVMAYMPIQITSEEVEEILGYLLSDKKIIKSATCNKYRLPYIIT